MDEMKEVELIRDELKLNYPIIHPEFFAFKFEDVNEFCNNLYTTRHTRFFEISIAKVDSGVISIADKDYDNLNNTLSFISPGQLFTYSSGLKQEKPIGINVLFKSSFLNPSKEDFHIQKEFQFFKLHTWPIFYLNEEQVEELYPLFIAVCKEQALNDQNSVGIVRFLILLLLNKLNRMTQSKLIPVKTSRKENISYNFEALVIENLNERWSVKNYASELNISSVYLAECVKKVTGRTPKQIVIDYQILAAKSLLSQTNKTVKEVALEMGFEELTNFTKFFKKNTLQSPKAFRNNLN